MKILKFDPGGSYKLKKFSLIATIFILIASFLFGSEARQWQVAADNPDSLVFHSGFEMGDFGEWSGGVTGSPSVLLAFSKLADPETLPTDEGYGAAFTSDGTYLAIAHIHSTNVTIYKRSGDTFTKLADPETLPTGNANGAAFTSDGTYLAIAHFNSPYVTIYKRSGDTFTKLADPETLPTGTGLGAAFTSDGTYLAIAHYTSPFVTIYKRSGDTFTKLTDPAILPTSYGNDAAFNSDGTYLAIAHDASPFVTIYKRSGDTFTKLTNPTTLPTGIGNGAAFTSDGTYLAIAHYTSPFVTIYKRSGDTFTKLTNPTTLPTGIGNGAAFTSDGTYLAIAHYTSPFVTIYKRSGDTFTKLAGPDTLPTGTSRGAAFTSDGTYLAIAHYNSPNVTIYIKAQPKTGECVMRCSPVTAAAYVDSGKGTMAKLTFYLLIRTAPAPDNDCYIAGDSTNGGIKLTATRELDLYSGGGKQVDGTTQLALNTWYRVSWLQDDTANTYIKLNGNTECSCATSVPIKSQIGVIIDEVTTTLYFDDFACDDATGPTDIGDIRVLRSSPNAAGEYTEYDSVSGYGNVDECPASDTDYVEDNGKDLVRECYNLQNATTIGIGESDTIEAVSVWIRGQKDGGGGTDHKILVRDDGTDEASANLDFSTDWTWFGKYYAVMPKDSATWTQTRFDGFQAGCQHLGGQDQRVSCVMVMVAYSPPEGPPLSSAIEIRAQDYTSTVTNITFPEAAPGVTVSLPYNNVDGSGNPQKFGNPAQCKPVVTLFNGAAVTFTIWYNITTFTNGIVDSENYLIKDTGTATSAGDITDAVTFDADTNTTTTIDAGANNEKDLYLKITLSEVAGKSGTSTLTILGETV